MQEREFNVPGMSCSHCEHAVRDALLTVAGVASVEVDLEAKRVVVLGEPLADEALRAAVADAGYEVA